MGRVWDFTKKRMVEDDEDRYEVKKREDGTLSIVRNARSASPRLADQWRSDPALAEAKSAIKSGNVAEFNSAQVRMRRPTLPTVFPEKKAAAEPVRPVRPVVKREGLMLPTAFVPQGRTAVPKQKAEQRAKALGFPWAQGAPAAPAKAVPIDLRLANAGVRSYQPQRLTAQQAGQAALEKRKGREQVQQDALAQMKAGVRFEDLLNKQTPLTDAEKIVANNFVTEREKQYRAKLVDSMMRLQSVSEEDQAFSMQTSALKDRISGAGAFVKGGVNALSFGGLDRVSRKQDEAARALSKMVEGPATQAAKQVADSHNGKSVAQIAKEENPLAYGVGSFAGETAKYLAYAPLIGEIPFVGKFAQSTGNAIAKLTGGRIGAQVATNLVSGRIVDLPFDVINAIQNTDNPGDFVKSVAGDQAMGLLTDGAVEGLVFGWKQIKAALKDGQLRKIMDADAIKDADIDAYLEKQHGGDTAKNQIIGAPTRNVAQYMSVTDPSNMNRYRVEIDGVFNGNLPFGKDVLLGKTPDVLVRHGAPDISLHMDQSTARKIAYPTGYQGLEHGHNLGLSVLKNLPYQLENPLAILKNPQSNAKGLESLIVLTEWYDEKGLRIVTPIHFNAKGAIEAQNNIASTFGADYLDTLLGNSDQNVIYTKNNEDIRRLLSTGVNSPKAMADDIFGESSIPFLKEKINGSSAQNASADFDAVSAPLRVAEEARARMQKQSLPTEFGQKTQVQGLPTEFGGNTVGAAESAFPHKQKVSQLYDNSFQKSSMFTQAEKELANREGMGEDFKYDVISEKQSMAEAMERVQVDFEGEMNSLPGKGSFGGADVDTSMLILEKKLAEARQSGNAKDVIKWAKMIQEKGTEAGQMIQAFAKYSRTPAGVIVKAEKAIADFGEKLRKANPKLFNAINDFADELARSSKDWEYDLPADPDAAVAKLKNAIEDMAKKNGKVKLDDDLTDEILKAIREGNGSRAEIEDILFEANGLPWLKEEETLHILSIMEEAEKMPLYSKQRYKKECQAWKLVADHFDSSFMDKWNAWRYMAMLGNTRTHIRNFLGNTVFGAVTRIKNGVGAVLEGVTDSTLKGLSQKGIERTKTLAAVGDTALHKAAKEDFTNMYALIMNGGKYNPSDMLRNNKTIFQNRVLEGARRFNSGALELEDELAMRGRYAANLTGFLKANGVDQAIFQDTSKQAEELLARARAYAIQEAKKATFRDDSVLANRLSDFSKSGRVANLIVEGIMPFKKTPINIVKRGIEYSPIGLAQGLGEVVHAIAKDPSMAAQAIDRVAAGLTGTGILALGYLLAEKNLLSASGSENARERGFDAMTGNQNYAVTVGGKSYTLDWVAPAALPLFVGAELYRTLGQSRELSGADMVDSITKIMEPVLDMTMMQGLNDAIASAAYNQTSALNSVAGNALANYATQGFPTSFGQVARAVDDTRRSVYYGKGSFLEKLLPVDFREKYSESPVMKTVLDAALSGPVDIAVQKSMAKLPGLSFFLNPKVDQWGREQKNQGGNFAGRLAYNMLSPGFYAEQNYTEVDRELERLAESTGERSVLPGNAAKTIAQKDAEGNKETKRLSAKEYTKFAKDKGGMAYKTLESVLAGNTYRNASDADKAKMVADVYEYTNAVAKTGVSDYKLSGWVEKAVEAEKEGIAPEDYIACRNVLTPLKYNVEKNEVLLGFDVSPARKESLYRYFVSDTESSQRKIKEFQEVGLDMDDYLTASIEYAKIDEAGGSAQDKATAFYQWLDTQNLTDREYETVADTLKYFQMIPAEPKAYRPDLMSEKAQEGFARLQKQYGITEDEFMRYQGIVADVEGVKGKNGKMISGSQKKARFRALVAADEAKGIPTRNAKANAREVLMALYGYKNEGWE